ncbi:hypothetical protein BDN72DRAFT_603022 [Pluteus cervinus]|uniref:Uncharacterized protein n=1 Tax=Pluteus cervinus TaxID=181527 RepID=A0ACD3BAA5_9AGAR|nr:hypothetical protein BDN72DRAFT_603022 [Pluteus cervinus]
MLPSLFKWSWFVHASDVPEDLLEPCIFALKMFLRLLEESPEQILRASGYYLPGQDPATVNHTLTANCRMKVTFALMNSKIDRPAEAAPCLKKSIEAETKQGSWQKRDYKHGWSIQFFLNIMPKHS